MKTLEAIHQRQSVRAFLDKPVPQEKIVDLLEAARWAPTGSARQPWQATVVAGETRDRLVTALVEQAQQRRPEASSASADPAKTISQRRALYRMLAEAAERMGMSYWDFLIAGSYGFYGAPVIVVVSYRGTPGSGQGDVDRFVTTLMLAAHDQGLGTIWLGYPLGYGDTFREILEVPEGEHLAAAVALGYPDLNSPANDFRAPRKEVEEFTRWIGFD